MPICRWTWPAFSPRLAWLLLALSPAGVSGSDTVDSTYPDVAGRISAETIAQLVDQLGSEQYAKREKAQAQLQKLGLDAFDALYEARESEDIEISMRARYLLQSLPIQWAHEDDPPRVRELLRGYDDKADDERQNLMEQLAVLPDRQGVPALCRLVRFESSNILSKRAALLIMQRADTPDDRAAGQLASSINDQIGPSQRDAARWLETYVRTLKNPEATLDDWQRIAKREELIFSNTPEKSDADLVRDLLRWQVELLERCGRDEETLAVILRTIDLVDGTRKQLIETVDWLVDRSAWTTVEEVAGRFPERFEESTLLLYRLAEAQQKSGRDTQSAETAARALEADPDSPQDHVEAALWLQERGHLDWSQREYAQVVQSTPPDTVDGLRARFLYSEMLHDLQRDREAADVLSPASEALDNNEAVRRLAALNTGRDAPSVRARMLYFRAEDFRRKGEIEKQVDHLRQAAAGDPTDADVLIAMYRAGDRDSALRKEAMKLIETAADHFRSQIDRCEQGAAKTTDERQRAAWRMLLASANNQFAWLVSNTEGDYDEALRCSQRSLELRPDTAGYLDTLGRCYFAKGDLENAVSAQSKAVELEPYTAQIRRQLEMFRQSLDAAKESKQTPP
jgi:tetratricopeptide (TPR) repeat protein